MAWRSMGPLLLYKNSAAEEALAICIKLLTQAPVEFKAWFLRGNILYALGRAAEALAAFDEALALDPKDLGALCNRGESLRQLGRLPEAAAMFGEALAANPRFVEALLGQGIVEFKSARTEEALGSFTAALEADPASATAHCGRGLALQELGRFGEAMDDFKRSLALDPSLVEGHSNLGALQLLLGDFKRGWEGYEYRKLWGGECKVDAKALWPVWNGELIAGKKLLVLDEAAHGDIILLARYFPILAALGADATFLCRPRMLELLKKVPGVRLTAEIGPSERFDYQVHLFSLPQNPQNPPANYSTACSLYRGRTRPGSEMGGKARKPWLQDWHSLAGQSGPQGRYGARCSAWRFRAAGRAARSTAHQPAEGVRHGSDREFRGEG